MAPSEAGSRMAVSEQAHEAPPLELPERPRVRPPDETTLVQIERLMRTQDDTSRFVALALLRDVLDQSAVAVTPTTSAAPSSEGGEKPDAGSAALSPEQLQRLWEALPGRFLDRLLRAAPPQADADAKRDLAVAVLHTFAVRLDGEQGHLEKENDNNRKRQKREAVLTQRISRLVSSLGIRRTGTAPSETTGLALQTLVVLVSRPAGAAAFQNHVTGSEDCLAGLRPLIHLAPTEPLALEILLRAWAWGWWDESEEAAEARPRTADVRTAITTASIVETTLPALAEVFGDTDGVTLLDFVARLLRNAGAIEEQLWEDEDEQSRRRLLPRAHEAWLHPVIRFIRRLAANRPTAAARAASTHAAAALLHAYPVLVPPLLFGPEKLTSSSSSSSTSSSSSSSDFAYLLISLLLVDLRASLPGLLVQLNSPTYTATSSRLASAFDVLSAFIGFLMRSLDGDDDDDNDDDDNSNNKAATLALLSSPDHLLRLRTSMAETLSLTAEYLRDRWDAAVAGAPGLHPDARAPDPHRATLNKDLDHRPLLPWDAAQADAVVSRDPLILAALGALSLWLREDDNPALRREVASNLSDMLLDLYRSSTPSSPLASPASPASVGKLDFRRPILVALEGITADADEDDHVYIGGSGGNDHDDAYADADDDYPDQDNVSLVLQHGLWSALTADLLLVFQAPTISSDAAASPLLCASHADLLRGIEIVRVLLPVAENQRPGIPPDWMDLVTHVAAWPGPDASPRTAATATDLDAEYATAASLFEFRVAVFQLLAALVARAHPAMRRRYAHSIAALRTLTRQLAAGTKDGLLLSASSRAELADTLDDILSTFNTV